MRTASWVAVVMLSVWASIAMAAGPSAVRKQVESSMLVNVTLDIEADGSVSGYRIDRQEALSPGVINLLATALPSWKFEPVTDQPIRGQASASLLLVAQESAKDRYSVRIANAHFGYDKGESPTGVQLDPPRYPKYLERLGVTGTVYLVLRIGKQGHVEDAVAEQVNLHVVGSEADMTRMRDQFARNSLAAARKWTFRPPVAGPEVDANEWSVRVPVDFVVGPQARYGDWISYVPGPRQSIPWAGKEDDFAARPDAMPAGGVYSSRSQGPRLLTSLDAN